MNAFMNNFNARAIASPSYARMHSLGFAAAHMGGGCEAWTRSTGIGDGYVLVCSEGNRFDARDGEGWLVANHSDANDEGKRTHAATLDAAVKICKDAGLLGIVAG